MNTELERIEAEALKLPVEDRERLIEALIDSLDRGDTTAKGEFGGFASADLQKYWLDEAERRIQDIRSGKSQTIAVDEAMAKVRSRLKDRREIR